MYNNIVNRDTGTTKARDSEMKDCGINERRHERALTFAKSLSKRYKACSGLDSANSFEAKNFRSVPITESKPSAAVVIWKGGATE